MSFLFGRPSTPEIRVVTPPKTITPPPTKPKEVDKVVEEEKKKITKGRRRGTILTSPRGILEPVQSERKSLLGQ